MHHSMVFVCSHDEAITQDGKDEGVAGVRMAAWPSPWEPTEIGGSGVGGLCVQGAQQDRSEDR